MNNFIGVVVVALIVFAVLVTFLLMCLFMFSGQLNRAEEQDWETREYKN